MYTYTYIHTHIYIYVLIHIYRYTYVVPQSHCDDRRWCAVESQIRAVHLTCPAHVAADRRSSPKIALSSPHCKVYTHTHTHTHTHMHIHM